MSMEEQMPREEGVDHSLNLIREGYLYILNRRHSFNSNVFETRLLGKKAICMGGEEAAKVFYDAEKFKRHQAAPNWAIQTLFGKGGVQTLDGQPHRHRKEVFMSLMSHEEIERLTNIVTQLCETYIKRWEQKKTVILYEEAQEILCQSACAWAGVPYKEEDIKWLTKSLGAMFESAAAVGPNHWLGRNARNAVEKWVVNLVEKVREGDLNPLENTALYKFSWHRDTEGNLLEPKVAAVEVINILRPIVAIAVYINFVALALHHFPEEREKLKSDNDNYAQAFIQEVRRFYPFFPFAAALVKRDFTWNDYEFEEGTLTLLDLYGTNHDAAIWDNPEIFNPGRFKNWEGSPFSFIPQGGGDYVIGHRCAGEWVTIEVMKEVLKILVNKMEYEIPKQDLSYSMVNMPSIPRSKVVLEKVKFNRSS